MLSVFPSCAIHNSPQNEKTARKLNAGNWVHWVSACNDFAPGLNNVFAWGGVFFSWNRVQRQENSFVNFRRFLIFVPLWIYEDFFKTIMWIWKKITSRTPDEEVYEEHMVYIVPVKHFLVQEFILRLVIVTFRWLLWGYHAILKYVNLLFCWII